MLNKLRKTFIKGEYDKNVILIKDWDIIVF